MELVADFTLNNQSLNAQFDVSEVTNFDALFQIDATFDVEGEGVIKATKSGGVITITSTTFVYEQAIASDTWIIEHNLNKRPSVFAVDTSGRMQIPDEIIYDSDNQVTVQFISAFAGKAYLN